MPFSELGDQQLYYSEQRDAAGPAAMPLVLVHGAGGTHMHWPPGLRRLPGHTVYALDLPGHGRSPGPGRDSIAGYVEVIRDWAAGLALPPFVLAGHSMGGAIAQAFALRYPRQLRGLVLVATGARLRVHPDILQRVQSDPEGVGALLVEWVHGPRATPAQKRQYLRHLLKVDAAVMVGDWQACNAFDSMERLGEITLPALVIGGTRDQMTPLKYAAFLCQRLPDADLTTIDDGGHMVMMEQPAAVIGAIGGFLERLRRGG